MTQLGNVRRAGAWKAIVLTAAVAAVPAVAAAQHASTTHSASGMRAASKNIVQVAVDAGSFETLVAAVKAAGLVETLQGEGPFTVFAPSDAAFAKLPKGTLESLLADKAALTSVLTFHVVPGRILAADIAKAGGATPKTVNGQALDVVVRDGKVYVNGAQVTSADIVASNGVIHVIDSVLLPAPAPAAGH
jgi:uncharacterized surface protein with fasciclin (FAS1) repeats